MSKIRVLIVDDSVVVRRLLSDLVSADPDLEVAGVAQNGRIALAKITQVNPDVVTLDLEMPEMDGLATLSAIREQHPGLPVLMLSRFTQRGAATTLEALANGATDYVTMPDPATGGGGVDLLRIQLLSRIKVFGTRSSSHLRSTSFDSPATQARPLSAMGGLFRPRVEVVAIGCSTGGPNALAQLLPLLPANFPVPIVVVQHMPPVFTQHLARRLNSQCAITVREATHGIFLEPSLAWLAPGSHHMKLAQNGNGAKVLLSQEPEVNSCRPSVDVLFRSVANVFGAGSLAVILTGMGKDGLRGCEEVRDVGGYVVAQDEPSSVVWGMPGAVVRAGLAHQVLPLEQIGAEINRQVWRGRSVVATLPPMKAPTK